MIEDNLYLDTDYLQSTFLSKANVVGADFEYALPDPAWIVSGYTATSTLLGNEEIISEIQRNSAHYFQRPAFESNEQNSFVSQK